MIQAVIYDFQPSRSGQHVGDFLKGWQGQLTCYNYSGYKARFKLAQLIEVGCMANARRKFHEPHVTGKNLIAEQALQLIQHLYQIEAELKELPDYSAEQRYKRTQQDSQPIMRQLYDYLKASQDKVLKSSPTAKAVNYSLKLVCL